MKRLFILPLLLLAACDNNEEKDPLTGDWAYTSVDSGKPSIAVTFALKRSAGTYDIDDLSVTIDGKTNSFSTKVESVVKGDRIGKITLNRFLSQFSGVEEKITFYNCDKLTTDPGWSIDSVVYQYDDDKFKYIGGNLVSK